MSEEERAAAATVDGAATLWSNMSKFKKGRRTPPKPGKTP
jgi:hypothetical protein